MKSLGTSRLALTLFLTDLECNEYSTILNHEKGFRQDIDDIHGNQRKMYIPPQRKP